MKRFLEMLLLSLNSIEVSGKKNLDTLLGSILAVEHMIAKIDKAGTDVFFEDKERDGVEMGAPDDEPEWLVEEKEEDDG